jgi:hypothetical protein
VIPRSGQSIEEVTVTQQGQVFKLKSKGADGQPLWAYRYRLEGRGSTRWRFGSRSTGSHRPVEHSSAPHHPAQVVRPRAHALDKAGDLVAEQAELFP